MIKTDSAIITSVTKSENLRFSNPGRSKSLIKFRQKATKTILIPNRIGVVA